MVINILTSLEIEESSSIVQIVRVVYSISETNRCILNKDTGD